MNIVDVFQAKGFVDAPLRLSGYQLHVRLCMPMALSSRKDEVVIDDRILWRYQGEKWSNVDEVDHEHGSNMLREYSRAESAEIVDLHKSTG